MKRKLRDATTLVDHRETLLDRAGQHLKKHTGAAAAIGLTVVIIGGMVLFAAFGGTAVAQTNDDGNTAITAESNTVAAVNDVAENTAAQEGTLNMAVEMTATNLTNTAHQVETGQNVVEDAEVAGNAGAANVVENPIAHPAS